MTQALLQKLGPSAIGTELFVVIVVIQLLVTEETSVAIVALTVALALALIGGTYFGFGASVRSMTTFWVGRGVAVFYAIVALVRLLWNPLAALLGLVAHAVWDALHHNGASGAPGPKWYLP